MSERELFEFFLKLPPLAFRKDAFRGEQRVSGSRTVQLEVCLDYHSQDVKEFVGKFVEEPLDFIALEANGCTEERAMSIERQVAETLAIERQVAEALAFMRQMRSSGDEALAEMVKDFTAIKSITGKNITGSLALALAKEIPVVNLERFDAKTGALGERMDRAFGSKINEAARYFISGKVDRAVEANYAGMTIFAIKMMMRDAEMARNIARLDEILGRAYFGLQGKTSLRGLANIGAGHYNVMELVSKAGPKNVTVALHPKSVDVGWYRRTDYYDEIISRVRGELEVQESLEAALQQVGKVRAMGAELRDLHVRALCRELLYSLARGSTEESDENPLVNHKISYHIVSRMASESIPELSRWLGERWFRKQPWPFRLFRGQAWSLTGNQKKEVMPVINDFLAANNYQVVPYTAAERRAFLEECVV